MRRFELIAPCHFGMESVLKREITDLGYDITEVADGRVTFFGDEEALCRANIFLRTAERILIKVQIVQPLGYSVHYEKSNGGAAEGPV
mgnify:CR=1 FL=1